MGLGQDTMERERPTDGFLGEAFVDPTTRQDGINQAFQRGIDESVERTLRRVKKRGRRDVSNSRAIRQRFERRLWRRWRPAFDLYDLTLECALTWGAEFNTRHRPQAALDQDFVFEVLARLHARACLVASEVRALLTSGHASGANARWRTLHELAVIAFFVKQHGREVAERYFFHEGIETAKGAEEYQEVVGRLGYDPLTEEELSQVRRKRTELVERFGSVFAEPYGWAEPALAGRARNFKEIERDVEMDHLRGHYRMASHGVHGQPKGSTFDLGKMGGEPIRLAGPSNVGLTDPADSALLSLYQCTVAFLTYKADPEYLVALGVLDRLRAEAGTKFLSIQQQLNHEEAAARQSPATGVGILG